MAMGGELEPSPEFSARYLFENCKCFRHRCLAFRQGEEPVCPSSYSERDFEPRLHFRALGLQLHFARQARRRTLGPTSLKKATATVAFRELGNKCGTGRGEGDSLIARRIVVFRQMRAIGGC